MFKHFETGIRVSKAEYDEYEPHLHTSLLQAQRELRDSKTPVVIIVSGVEGAGKGEVVSLLNRWLDTRGIQTHAFWDETEDDRMRPRYWRFWQALPPRGSMAILFGSWYTRPIIDCVFDRVDSDDFDREMRRIIEFEQLLIDDGTRLIKIWLHLSEKAQKKRLKEDVAIKGKIVPPLKKFAKRYTRFCEVCEHALRKTGTEHAPWHLVDAENSRNRDLTVGKILLSALQQGPVGSTISEPLPGPTSRACALAGVDLSRKVEEQSYERLLEQYQARLRVLAWKARGKHRNTVIVFEGWDAAGKGGAIRRITAAIDARLYRVISVAAPTDEEKAHHYLWRFWRHVPRAGYVTIYDRSWYGRVLVERVEGFAQPREWGRGYREINDFEEQLADHGIVLIKFWLHLSAEEQLRRFREREVTAWKQHKITDEDWRNRDKWAAYEQAVNDMVARTDAPHAPWTLVAANDKRSARLDVLRTVCERLEAAL